MLSIKKRVKKDDQWRRVTSMLQNMSGSLGLVSALSRHSEWRPEVFYLPEAERVAAEARRRAGALAARQVRGLDHGLDHMAGKAVAHVGSNEALAIWKTTLHLFTANASYLKRGSLLKKNKETSYKSTFGYRLWFSRWRLGWRCLRPQAAHE